eukprot:TRINITY_DN66884_c7_g3_i1.p2 TRINITY_DN66884_c7_g3~~TRINITY_DN66884_c7_g3_i1.p2  ORF type:complete len:205 (+),score=5.58 TRINITY_DN66884_c7_g3_i1:393-1007(+)
MGLYKAMETETEVSRKLLPSVFARYATLQPKQRCAPDSGPCINFQRAQGLDRNTEHENQQHPEIACPPTPGQSAHTTAPHLLCDGPSGETMNDMPSATACPQSTHNDKLDFEHIPSTTTGSKTCINTAHFDGPVCTPPTPSAQLLGGEEPETLEPCTKLSEVVTHHTPKTEPEVLGRPPTPSKCGTSTATTQELPKVCPTSPQC